MSRGVLDYNISDDDVDKIMNHIVAQNPQLNAQIEQVRNESNVFLCKILRVYPFEDKALVKVLNDNRNVFCRLSHEIIGSGLSIDYIPNGVEKVDYKYFRDKKYIEPFDNLYGVVIKVRWLNLDDENVLLGYVNVDDDYNLKSDSDKGEISIKSGSSIISVDDERVNIMTPSLFINGLPYDEPELHNYYDKRESDIITNTINETIKNNESEINDKIDELKSKITNANTGEINISNLDVDFNYEFGVKGVQDTIDVNIFLKEKNLG